MNPTLTFELFSCFSSSTKLDNATTAQLSLWKKKLWSQDALDFFPFKKVFIFSRFSQEGQTKEQKKSQKIANICFSSWKCQIQNCFNCSTHFTTYLVAYLIVQDFDVILFVMVVIISWMKSIELYFCLYPQYWEWLTSVLTTGSQWN